MVGSSSQAAISSVVAWMKQSSQVARFPSFGAHGWAEGAAEDGAVLVEVAGAVFEIEDGTGLVVGELFEEDGCFVVFVEDAGGDVAGEPGVEAV